MIEVGIIVAGATGVSLVISVLFYNMRRSRCIKCKGCGCSIERQNMTQDEMANDKLEMPTAI
jgi:hypothetical protein